MKKLLLILFVAIIAIGALWYYKGANEEPQDAPPATTAKHPDASGATFIFDEGPVTLSRGRSEVVTGTFVEEVTLSDKVAYGDLNNDGREDAAVVLFQSGGGSGTFIYVAALVSSSSSYKGSNAIFIGDRISPQSLSIDKGVLTFKYLDREEGESFAEEPTMSVTKTFVYRSGRLEER